MTPSERLSAALKPNGFDLDRLTRVAELADVPLRVARMAARGRPVSACHFLRLCAAAGHDPFVIGRAFAPFRMAMLSRRSLGDALNSHRRQSTVGHNMRDVATRAGTSIRTISFVENAQPVSPEHVLAVCGYLNIHPFHFAKMFHGEQRCNKTSTERQAA